MFAHELTRPTEAEAEAEAACLVQAAVRGPHSAVLQNCQNSQIKETSSPVVLIRTNVRNLIYQN